MEFNDGELEAPLDDSADAATQVTDLAGVGIMPIDEAGQLELMGASHQIARPHGGVSILNAPIDAPAELIHLHTRGDR